MTPCSPSESLPPPSTVRSGWPWDTTFNNDNTTSSIGCRDWPKITIVTPSFNQAPFLEETIRSVLLQGYPNLEYIIMDGGSTDGSVEIIRKYEPWLTYWQSEHDNGQAEAINNGWKRSTGYAITWLNSDDVFTPGSLMKSMQTLSAEEGHDLVYGDNIVIDENSVRLRTLTGRPFSFEDVVVKGVNPIPQPGFIMKRELLNRIGMLDQSLHFAMDFDYWVRVALSGSRTCYVPHHLAMFREHVGAKTSKAYLTRISDRYRIFEKVFDSAASAGKLSSLKKKARAAVELNAAYIAYKAKDWTRARRHALNHIQLAGLQSSPLGWGILAFSLRLARV